MLINLTYNMNKKIKNWISFILEQQNNSINFSIFDWDDNILIMNTPLHLQHFENGRWINKDVSIQEFSNIRLKYPDNYVDNSEWKADKNSFIEFTDCGTRVENVFLDDVKVAIKNKEFGPSWTEFIDTLKNGNLFAIITIRGHESNSIRKAIRHIIDYVLEPNIKEQLIENIQRYNNLFKNKSIDLIEQYLDCCYFIGLMSQEFKDEYSYSPVGNKLNEGRQDAINKFSNYVKSIYPNATKEVFVNMEKSLNFPEIQYTRSTSDNKIPIGVRVKI